MIIKLLSQDEGMTAGAQTVLPRPLEEVEEDVRVEIEERESCTVTNSDLEALDGEAA